MIDMSRMAVYRHGVYDVLVGEEQFNFNLSLVVLALDHSPIPAQ